MMKSMTSKRYGSGRYAILHDGELVGTIQKGSFALAGNRLHNDWWFRSAHFFEHDYKQCVIPGFHYEHPIHEATFPTKAAALEAVSDYLTEKHDIIVKTRRDMAARLAERRAS